MRKRTLPLPSYFNHDANAVKKHKTILAKKTQTTPTDTTELARVLAELFIGLIAGLLNTPTNNNR